MWKFSLEPRPQDPIFSLWASPAPAAPTAETFIIVQAAETSQTGVTVESVGEDRETADYAVCKSSQAENEQVGRVKDQIIPKCCSHGNRRDKAIEIKRTHIY